MKKTLIALAAVAVSSAAMAQVTVYGVFDTGYAWSSTKNAAGTNTASTAGLVSGTMSGSRLGFRGTEELEGGMKAGFQYEAGIDATNGQLLANGSAAGVGFARVARASLEGGFGTVMIGRGLLPSYLAATGFDATGASGAHEVTDLNVNGVRNNGVWYANKFGPVALSAFVVTGKSGSDAAPNKSRGYDVSATFTSGPLTAAAAITSQKTQLAAVAEVTAVPGNAGTAAAAASDATVTGTVLGASYDLGVAKVMVNLLNQKTKNNVAGTATKSAETNFGVSVPMGKTTLMAGVGTDTTKDAAGVKSTGLDYSIGASYAMSKRTNVFAFMSQDETPALKGDRNAVTNTTTVGLRHTF